MKNSIFLAAHKYRMSASLDLQKQFPNSPLAVRNKGIISHFFFNHANQLLAVTMLLFGTVSSVSAAMETYTGSINGTVSETSGAIQTSIPMFNDFGGTRALTGVQIELYLTVTPYAQIYNYSMEPAIFSSDDSVSYGYDSDTWIVSHGSDNWALIAPTVSTGTIFGSEQTVWGNAGLTLVGDNSASVTLTASASPGNLASYVSGNPLFTLFFWISGPGTEELNTTGPFWENGGGGNLEGAGYVTYSYVVPEPATLLLLGLGAITLRRKHS